MKITIITPSYNHGKYIEKNILSVINQNWNDIEHIVIDGGSTDTTVEVLQKYPHVRWVSEKDEGQADALNKGIAMATGDIIGWINSDDYYEKNIFKDVINEFKNKETQWIIGNISLNYPSLNMVLPISSPEVTYKNLINNADIVKQQGAFYRKEAIDEVGRWDKQFFMVMDFDLWVRLSKKWRPAMVNKQWALFTMHEDQKSSHRNSIIQIKEIERILKKEGLSFFEIKKILLKKYFYYLKGFLKTILIDLNLMNKSYRNIPMSIKRQFK